MKVTAPDERPEGFSKASETEKDRFYGLRSGLSHGYAARTSRIG
jgi:hypothetical protein